MVLIWNIIGPPYEISVPNISFDFFEPKNVDCDVIFWVLKSHFVPRDTCGMDVNAHASIIDGCR